MTDGELAEAVHWLMDVNDPDVQTLVRNVVIGLGVDDLVAWASEAPDEVMALYEAASDMVEQAPLEDTFNFTTGGRDRSDRTTD